MAFPTTIDSFPNPSASDFRIGHAALHTSVNTAIVALETLLGITGSTDVNSIIYKLTAAQTRLTALSNVDNTSDVNKPLSNAMQSALNNKVSSTIAVNGHQLTSSITVTQDDIGLGFVNNTSDITKWAAIATLTNKTFDNSTNTLVFGGNQSIGGFRLTNLGEPTASSDAATKSYVDNISFGINNKITVKLATITTLPAYTYNNGTAGVWATLTANAVGILTVDGVATVLNNYILVKNEATPAYNGVYKVTTEGTAGVAFILTRAVEQDESVEFVGAYIFVTAGSLAYTGWNCTSTVTTVGTTAVVFTQTSFINTYLAGTGLQLVGNTFSITSVVATLTGTQTLTNKSLTSPIMTGEVDQGGALVKVGSGSSPLRTGSWHLTSGDIYNLIQPQFTWDLATWFWIHNGSVDLANGNFLGRDNAEPSWLMVLTESGRFDRYDAVTGAIGSIPSFTFTGPLKTSHTNTVITTTGGTTTLSSSESFSDSYEVTGVLTSNATIIVPNTIQVVSFENLTTGAYTVTVKTSAGTGFSFSTTEKNVKRLCYANGTNVEVVNSDDIPQGTANLYATALNIATITHAAPLKVSIVDNDEVYSGNSATSFSIVRSLWSNVRDYMKTYFDTIYRGLPLRVYSEATHNGSTPQIDLYDQHNITALATADAFAAPVGTPTDGQNLIIRIKDNGTARALTWNAIYRASTDLPLPSTTTVSKTMYLGFKYNNEWKWDLLAYKDNI